jgi:hypothetical protein
VHSFSREDWNGLCWIPKKFVSRRMMVEVLSTHLTTRLPLVSCQIFTVLAPTFHSTPDPVRVAITILLKASDQSKRREAHLGTMHHNKFAGFDRVKIQETYLDFLQEHPCPTFFLNRGSKASKRRLRIS